MTRDEIEALARFRAALRKFLKYSETSAEVSGISTQTYQALLAIKGTSGSEQVTIGALAESLMIKHNSAVGLVDRLAAQGLVVRRESPLDRRRVYLQLTEAGDRIVLDVAERNRVKLLELKPEFASLLSGLEELSRRSESG